MGLLGWLGIGLAKMSKSKRMVAGYLSDMAVAVIGEGDKLDIANGFDYKISRVFDRIKEHSDELDALFIEPLESVFCHDDSKYRTLLSHFEMFKEAHLNPIIGTLVEDSSLCNLVLGDIRVKLCEFKSISETNSWRKYHEVILDYLGSCVSKPGGSLADYEYGLASAFADSAVKLNPSILTAQDCRCFREKTFSAPLMKILAEHFQLIRMAYVDAVRS